MTKQPVHLWKPALRAGSNATIAMRGWIMGVVSTCIVMGGLISCGGDDAVMQEELRRRQEARRAQTTATKQEATQADTAQADVHELVYGDDSFVESEQNRDPFRNYVTLFKIKVEQSPQRRVMMPTTGIEEMKLIAIIQGIPRAKAMIVDPMGVGHVVERGMYIGRPQVVQASENVSMTLHWRIERIRDNEVVLTREDPTDPTRPPLTRVIPLREEELEIKG